MGAPSPYDASRRRTTDQRKDEHLVYVMQLVESVRAENVALKAQNARIREVLEELVARDDHLDKCQREAVGCFRGWDVWRRDMRHGVNKARKILADEEGDQ